MKYSRVYLDAIGYELPPVVVTSQELEARLQPVYQALRLPEGQLEALTGIHERRWWEPGYPVSQGATAAARKALERSNVRPQDLDVLIYAGVCREQFEPATACSVAAALGVRPDAVFDLSNACLGVLNGIVDIANRIELGQVRAGLVVSCETAREINDVMIETHAAAPQHGDVQDLRGHADRRLRGGRRAADGRLVRQRSRGGGCWAARRRRRRSTTACAAGASNTVLDARPAVHVHRLGGRAQVRRRAGPAHLERVSAHARLGQRQVDKVICHQVGAGHRDLILRRWASPREGILDLRLPRQHRHRVAAADGGPGGGARVPAAGRPRRLPRHRQRPELLDARGGMVKSVRAMR